MNRRDWLSRSFVGITAMLAAAKLVDTEPVPMTATDVLETRGYDLGDPRGLDIHEFKWDQPHNRVEITLPWDSPYHRELQDVFEKGQTITIEQRFPNESLMCVGMYVESIITEPSMARREIVSTFTLTTGHPHRPSLNVDAFPPTVI